MHPPERAPRSTRLLHTAAITALLGVAVALGCASDPAIDRRALLEEGLARTRRTVAEVVDDADRRERALALLDEFAATEHQFLDDTGALHDRLDAVHADHAATRADYEVVLDALQSRRAGFADHVASSWVAFAGVLEPDELDSLVEAHAKEDERWRARLQP